MCYIPQGRNIFPELSVLHNLELGGIAAEPGSNVNAKIAAAMERFPMLKRKAGRQASTLSGGEQKLLEIARGLLLEPKLMLHEEVVGRIRDILLDGEIPPGARIPERELCWFGDAPFLPHLWKALGTPGFSAEVNFGEPRTYTERRAAARETWERVVSMRSSGNAGSRPAPFPTAAPRD